LDLLEISLLLFLYFGLKIISGIFWDIIEYFNNKKSTDESDKQLGGLIRIRINKILDAITSAVKNIMKNLI